MAHLSSGRVNLALVREGIRRQLLKCLDKCPGSKVLGLFKIIDKIIYIPLLININRFNPLSGKFQKVSKFTITFPHHKHPFDVFH